MPQSIGAAAGAFSATAAGGAIIAAAKYLATQLFFSALARKLAGRPPRVADEPPALRRVQITGRGATAAREFVYGETVKAGQMVFLDTVDGDGFTVWSVYALAGHEIEEISEVLIDGTTIDLSTDIDGSGDCTLAAFIDEDSNKLLRIKTYLGTDSQTADSDMVTDFTTSGKWSSDHRLRGVPYVAMRMGFDRSDMSGAGPLDRRVWFQGFPQSIRFKIKGKKVYDPREGSHDANDSTTWAYSNNAALCTADYIRDSDIGLAAESSQIDYTILQSSATNCDEPVTVWAGTGDSVTTTTQARYTVNGVLSSDQSPASIIEALLEAMAGTATESAGKIEIYPGRYDAPVMSLGDDDFAGPIRYNKAPPKRDRWNYVRGQFTDPVREWQPAEFTPRANSTYEADDGARLPRDLRFPLVTNEQRAQRLGMIYLKASRLAETAEFVFKANAIGIKRHDTIEVSNTELGWVNKIFRVTEWDLVPASVNGVIAGFHVKISARSEDAAAYTVSYAADLDDVGPTGLLTFEDREPLAVNTAQALGVIGGIRIEYYVPPQSGLQAIELWRSATNDRSVATLRATLSPGLDHYLDEYIDFKSVPPVPMHGDESYFYWLQVRSDTGNASTWFPVSATGGLLGESQTTVLNRDDFTAGPFTLGTTEGEPVAVATELLNDDSDVAVNGSGLLEAFTFGSPPTATPTQTVEYRLVRDFGGANVKVLKTASVTINNNTTIPIEISAIDVRAGDSGVAEYEYSLRVRRTITNGGRIEISNRQLSVTQYRLAG